MDAALILEKINKIEDVKNFIPILKIRFSSNTILLEKLEIVQKFLEKILFDIAFDLEVHLQNLSKNKIKKDKIIDKMKFVLEQIYNLDDELLKQDLDDLDCFVKDYSELKSISLLQDQNSIKLKEKISSILFERFF